jgi:hypothetical protein
MRPCVEATRAMPEGSRRGRPGGSQVEPSERPRAMPGARRRAWMPAARTDRRRLDRRRSGPASRRTPAREAPSWWCWRFRPCAPGARRTTGVPTSLPAAAAAGRPCDVTSKGAPAGREPVEALNLALETSHPRLERAKGDEELRPLPGDVELREGALRLALALDCLGFDRGSAAQHLAGPGVHAAPPRASRRASSSRAS